MSQSLTSINISMYYKAMWINPNIIDRMPSEKTFGIFLTFLLSLVLGFGWLNNWNETQFLVLLISTGACLIVSFFLPLALRPLNLLWYLVGKLLSSTTNPLILGFIYFFVITPVSVLLRAKGRDILMLQPRQNSSFRNSVPRDITSLEWFRRQY